MKKYCKNCHYTEYANLLCDDEIYDLYSRIRSCSDEEWQHLVNMAQRRKRVNLFVRNLFFWFLIGFFFVSSIIVFLEHIGILPL